ncbi:SIR2 family NAD-dependent protein deacylase [Thermoflexus hugenholtzii]|uniref:NAD-dependent protein deacylase n=1 Tax=Thermoflexus hugenholtzii JAD2 TaxID=877466 RepID=A0A212R9J8_9CHLR|nr:NAD-dependent deacylase [Thermoflexus hugenholtzii]SNB68803.1 NAD-dependent deacetylase [Thermoflexus hugenholtzii JAD2]
MGAMRRRVVALTGAGVSAESGVPTFRGPEGLWRRYRPEELASPEAFARDPIRVWEWYAWRRECIARATPNPAHRTLAAMEEVLPDFLLITQNVDGLHSQAGSRRVIELHGSLWRMRCVREGRVWEDRRVPLPELPPRCPACGALARPDVVWFGEPLPKAAWTQAFRAAAEAEIFLIIGTSGLVEPAASLPRWARAHGARLIEFNIEDTALTPLADEVWRGPVGETLPRWWAQFSGAS